MSQTRVIPNFGDDEIDGRDLWLPLPAGPGWSDAAGWYYPEIDPPEWHKLLPIRQVDGEIQVRGLPLDFHLQPPYAPTYEESYRLHCRPGLGD